jgi:hypothetical protein
MIKEFGISRKMRHFEEMSHHGRKLSEVFAIISSPLPCRFGVVLRIINNRRWDRWAVIRRARRRGFQGGIKRLVLFGISSEAKTEKIGGGRSRHDPSTLGTDQLCNFSQICRRSSSDMTLVDD